VRLALVSTIRCRMIVRGLKITFKIRPAPRGSPTMLSSQPSSPIRSLSSWWHGLDLKKKFNLFLVIFLLPSVGAISYLTYYSLRNLLIEESQTKAKMVLEEAGAIRAYVREVLRPEMYGIVGRDGFVIEAMSTTFISVWIQKKFGQDMPGYTYRRVATRPRNPQNALDDLEKDMLRWFKEDRDLKIWSGEVDRAGRRVFFIAEPVVVSEECMKCHGKPEDSPPILRERYGNQSGFHYKVGEVMGLNSVSVPVSEALGKIRRATLVIAAVTVVGFLVLMVVTDQIFGRLVAHRLGFLMRLSERLVDREKSEGDPVDPPPGDEIKTLEEKMDYLARHVRTLQSSYGVGPKFVGEYVVEGPKFPGFVSWLYAARHSLSDQEVSLKIPFPSLVKNPYYYHAFTNELQILESIDHRNVIGVRSHEQDFLVMEPIDGRSLKEIIEEKRKLAQEEIKPMFAQLCEVMSYLHNRGIVHHNLSMTNIVVTEESVIKLIDFGLAWSRDLVDPIAEAGAGIQGTPETIAPEQLKGARGDERSDIYAMGGILYTLLAGELPFTSGASPERLGLRMLLSPTPPRVHEPSIPLAVEATILKSLEADPEDRYQWVEDFCRDLAASW
jgi:uncharacterized protein DUF3365/protein kinase-like protein